MYELPYQQSLGKIISVSTALVVFLAGILAIALKRKEGLKKSGA